MIHKIKRIVKRMITRNNLPPKTHKVSPDAQSIAPARVVFVHYGEGDFRTVAL